MILSLLVCQLPMENIYQSLYLLVEALTFKRISSMHFYSWKKELKTKMYNLRNRPSSKIIQFTVSPETCESCFG